MVMKYYKLILLLICIQISQFSFTQSVGISNTTITPDTSALLELRSTEKGILIPRLTTTQRNAIVTPAKGVLVFNNTTNTFNYYDGTTWIELAPSTTVVNSISGTTNRINISGSSNNSIIDISNNYVGQTSITTLGTISSGTWNGSLISPTYGGTGLSSYTIGDLIFANGSSSLSKLSGVATGNALISGGVGSAPTWGKINLANHITGTLPVTNGGTGATTLTGIIKGNGTNAFTIASGGTDFVVPNAAITGATNTKITYDSKGLVTAGSQAAASDLSNGTTGTGTIVLSNTPTLITPNLGVANSTSETISGISGNGFIELQAQSIAPSVGSTNSIRLYSNNNGGLAWRRQTDGFNRNITSILTADRTYTLPDASGTIPVSASGNIALSAAGNISFTGTLPIANGGTNSSTALNNNRIMVSNSGAIREASALSNGQLLIGSTNAAPVAANLTEGNGIKITNSAGNITIANEPTIIQVSNSTPTTTTSTTDVLLTNMSITPGAGNYMVFFTGNLTNTNDKKQGTISFYKNGVKIADSEINTTGFQKESVIPVSITRYITGVNAGEAIDVRWNVISNTGTFYSRTLIVQKVK